MKRFRAAWVSGVLMISWVTSALGAEARHPFFPHEKSDLDPDPRVTFGRLENGLRYAILVHPVPAGTVSLRLHVEAGAYHETDAELGYAHFVEHMVFNGTRDFPGQQVFQALQNIGANVGGPDANATTSRFETDYHIDNLPSDQSADIALALRILRNFADGARFDEKEVAQERGVILAEGRSTGIGRLTQGWTDELEFIPPIDTAIRVHELEGLFDETRVEFRRPIGSARVIQRATAKSLRAFYDRWYRPEQMVLVIAGDIDPAMIQKMIAGSFNTFTARGPAVPPPEVVPPRVPRAPYPRIFGRQQPHAAKESVTLASVIPRTMPDLEETRRLTLLRRLALEMIVNRMVREATMPVSLQAWIAHAVPGWDIALIRNEGLPEDVTHTAILLDTEIRRAIAHGFAPLELESAAREAAVQAAQQEANAANWNSAMLAQAVAFATARGIVFTSPQDDRRRAESTLKEITPEECLAALRSLWPVEATQVLLLGPQPKNRSENGALRSEMDLARAIPVARPKPAAAPPPFPYTDFGTPGEVVEEHYDHELDCWFVQFANGVRLNFKATSTERDWVRYTVSLGDGNLGAPVDRRLYPWSFLALARSNVTGVASWQTKSPLLGLSPPKSLSLYPDTFDINNELPARDLGRSLQFLAATLRHTDWNSISETSFRSTLVSQRTPLERTARGVAQHAFDRMVEGSETLRGPTVTEVATLPFSDALAWLKTELATCPIEISIVGHVDRASVTKAVAQTLGTFPLRRARLDRDDPRRNAPLPGPATQQLLFSGDRNLGFVALGWTMLDAPGKTDDVQLMLLAAVVRNRLSEHIREKLGLTYSPSAQSGALRVLQPARLVLQCEVEAAPKQLARVATAAREIVSAIARDGTTAEEVERARRPLLRQMQHNEKSNAWWLTQLRRAQFDPESIDGLVEQSATLAKTTHEEINALARQVLDPKKAIEITARPK